MDKVEALARKLCDMDFIPPDMPCIAAHAPINTRTGAKLFPVGNVFPASQPAWQYYAPAAREILEFLDFA